MDATATATATAPGLGESSSSDASTARFDPGQRPSGRKTHTTIPGDGVAHGNYVVVPSTRQALLIPSDGSTAHVGRGFHADLSLDDASVSRRHAIILGTETGYEILDDRSLNGTFVNGQEISTAELQDGDVITLGRVKLIYREM